MDRREWLKQFRLEKGLTQVKVAEEVGITLRYYQMIEQGRKNPSVFIASRIGKLLGFKWYDFKYDFFKGEQNEEA